MDASSSQEIARNTLSRRQFVGKSAAAGALALVSQWGWSTASARATDCSGLVELTVGRSRTYSALADAVALSDESPLAPGDVPRAEEWLHSLYSSPQELLRAYSSLVLDELDGRTPIRFSELGSPVALAHLRSWAGRSRRPADHTQLDMTLGDVVRRRMLSDGGMPVDPRPVFRNIRQERNPMTGISRSLLADRTLFAAAVQIAELPVLPATFEFAPNPAIVR